MKRLPILLFCYVAACSQSDSSDWPTWPVDAIYQTEINLIEETCGRETLRESWSGLYEAFLRPDGLYDLQPYYDGRASWPPSFQGVELVDGKIDHETTWRDGATGNTHPITAKGSLSHDALDIVIDFGWDTKAEMPAPCHQVIHVTGRPWQVLEPAATEGKYYTFVWAASDDGFDCSESPDYVHPSRHFMLHVNEHETRAAKFSFFGSGVRFEAELRTADNAIGELQSIEVWTQLTPGYVEYEGRVNGIFTPEKVDLEIAFWWPGSHDSEIVNPNCAYKFRVTGEKHVPSVAALTNEYRSAFSAHDSCAGSVSHGYERLYLIEQDGGYVEFITSSGLSFWLSQTDSGFYEEIERGTERHVYDGSISLPHLEYEKLFYREGDPRACRITRHGNAHGRFIFGTESDPVPIVIQ